MFCFRFRSVWIDLKGCLHVISLIYVPPPPGTGVPSSKGPGTSHWGAPIWTWDQWKYYGLGTRPHVWTDKQTENITFPILLIQAVKITKIVLYKFYWFYRFNQIRFEKIQISLLEERVLYPEYCQLCQVCHTQWRI